MSYSPLQLQKPKLNQIRDTHEIYWMVTTNHLRAGRAGRARDRETQNHEDKNILQNETHFVF